MAEIINTTNLTGNDELVIQAIVAGTYFAKNETPSGSVNGSNVTFTLASSPSPTGSLELMLNGQTLKSGSGNDFTLSGATITMTNAPASGDVLTATYTVSPV